MFTIRCDHFKNKPGGFICSSPIKEKHSKNPTGKYVVPHKRKSIVNPNGGTQRVIPGKESPGIPNLKGDPS